MKKEQVIRSTEKFVKELLGKEGTGHDWWHIERVRNNAKLIYKSEKGADWFIADLAILLHDVGDWKVIKKENDDYSIAENFLREQKVPDEIITRILFIIKNMSFSKSLNNKNNLASIEFCIVQDADRLDAMGAIGIARTFAYGGSRSRPLYDPTKKTRKINTAEDYKKNENSSFHHFGEKLLLLKDLMNTRTAYKIAKERHNYMKDYLKQFLAEWEGKR